MATPSVTLSHDKAPLGSPIDITYKFVVANDAKFAEDYRVMVHVVDADEELMLAVRSQSADADHAVEAGRDDRVHADRLRPDLSVRRRGDDSGRPALDRATRSGWRSPARTSGQNAYRVARLQLQPQTENVFTVFKDGWHPAEVAEQNATVEWQWTKKDATLAFKNPKKDALFYFDVDNPGSVFNEPQR